MPRAKTRAVLVLCGWVAVLGCGGASAPRGPWVIADYKPDPMKLVMLAVAPAPLTGDLGNRIDVILEYIFNDTPGSQLRLRPAAMRQQMLSDRGLVTTLTQVLAQRYGSQELQRSPTLLGLMSQRQIDELRGKLGDSDMLIVPEELVLHPTTSQTSGTATFRVYDLHTGRLVLQTTVAQTVAVGGAEGDKKAAIELVITAQQQFARALLPPR